MAKDKKYSVSIEATVKGTKAPVVKRSQITPEYRYTMEVQSTGGNWNKSLATNDWNTVAGQANFEVERGSTVRIVDETQ